MNDTGTPTRRRVVMVLAGAPLLGATVASCTTGSPGRRTIRGGRPDADARVRWHAARTEHTLLILHAATVERHAGLADVIEPFSTHHRQHLAALLNDGPLPRLAGLHGVAHHPGVEPAEIVVDLAAVEPPDVPEDRGDALDAVRGAELAAAESHMDDCLHTAGPRLAALLASMGAAEATHDAALDGR